MKEILANDDEIHELERQISELNRENEQKLSVINISLGKLCEKYEETLFSSSVSYSHSSKEVRITGVEKGVPDDFITKLKSFFGVDTVYIKNTSSSEIIVQIGFKEDI